MHDYQRITDLIQALLASAVEPDANDVRRANERLKDAVLDVNERLRTCDALLRKGRRSDALQRCEVEPNLLDAVATLDIPEWNDWANYVNSIGLDASPELKLEVAAELNEAYSIERPLERLLSQHRVLALARAPLKDRLSVVRRVRRADPQNPLWEQDVRNYERERLGQIRQALERAKRGSDVAGLSEIEAELREPGWIEKPPSRLLSEAAKFHTRIRAVQAKREMEQLEQELTAAFTELDVERGRRARERWNALQRIVSVPATDPLIEMATPALDWLDKQDQSAARDQEYQQASWELEQAIEREASREELDRAWHAVVKTGSGLPPLLQHRFHERQRYLESRARRKGQLLIAAAVAGALSVATVVVFYIRQQTQSAEAAEHSRNVASLLEAGQLPEAQRYLDALEPQVTREPEIQRLQADVRSAVATEEGRQAELRSLLRKARTIGLTDPDWESIAAAESEADHAAEVARSEGERAQVEQLRSDLWSARKDLQQGIDRQFDGDLEAFQQRITDAPDGDVAAIDGLLAEARELASRARVSETRQASLPGLTSMLAAKRELAVREAEIGSTLSRVTEALGNERAYREALDAYARQFPDTPRSADFQKAIAEAPLWSGVLAWENLRDHWKLTDFRALTAANARADLQRLAETRSRAAQVPMPPELAAAEELLQAISSRVDDAEKPATERITAFLARKGIAEVHMVRTLGGEAYYITAMPRVFNEKNWVVNYFTSLDLERPSQKVVGELVTDAIGKVAVRSPQSIFAKYATQRFAETERDGWETVFIEVLESLHSDEEMDPLLKLLLYRLILETGCAGSVPLRDAFHDQLALVSGVSIDPAANWMDPEDARTRAARTEAEAPLKKLDSPALYKQRVESRLGSLASLDLGPERRWSGWLTRNADGKFSFRSPSPQRQDGELFVVYVTPDASEAAFHPVGRLADGHVTLSQPQPGETTPSNFIEGRPVFLSVRSEG